MLDILLILGLITIGYQLGKFITLLRIHDDIIQTILDHRDNTSIKEVYKLKVEKVESILYLYDDENNFICQAETLEELAKLSQQYKKIDYAAVIHNDKVFKFVNGSATET
jgi:hypothetical protein